MRLYRSLAIATLLAICVSACGSEPQSLDSPRQVRGEPQSTEYVFKVRPVSESVALIQQKFNGGQPGEAAHEPNTLVVLYHPGLNLSAINAQRAALLAGTATHAVIPGGSVAAGSIVAEQIADSWRSVAPAPQDIEPSPALRENPDMAPLNRYLAARYGLTLRSELSFSVCNYAVYKAPRGSNLSALATRLFSENADIVYTVEPNWIAKPDSFWPRQNNPQADNIPEVGVDLGQPSGCVPTYPHNGFSGNDSVWDYGEGYGFFQSGAYRSAASRFAFSNLDNVLPGLTCRAFVADSGVIGNHPDLPTTWSATQPQALEAPSDGIDPAYWDTTGEDYLPFMDVLSDNDPNSPAHGTAVCGIIGARERNQGLHQGMLGVIPNCKIYPFKIAFWEDPDPEDELDIERGQSTEESMSRAVLSAVALNSDAHIMNMSYGSRHASIPALMEMSLVAASLRDPHFVLVCSAGNDNLPVLELSGNVIVQAAWPAAFAADWFKDPLQNPDGVDLRNVASIQAVNIADNKAGFSNVEHVSAPGSITVAAPGGDWGVGTLSTSATGNHPNSFPILQQFNGTSAAAPHVTGAMALVQAYAWFDAETLISHIRQTARATRWDGTPLAGNVEPLLNFDRAMSWIDVGFAFSMPAPGQTPTFNDSLPVVIWRRQAAGELDDDQGFNYVSLRVFHEVSPGQWQVYLGLSIPGSMFSNWTYMDAESAATYFDTSSWPSGNYVFEAANFSGSGRVVDTIQKAIKP